MNKNCIVYSSNFLDLFYLQISLNSLRLINKDIDVYILTDNNLITNEIKQKLSVYNINYIDCYNLFKSTFSNKIINLKIQQTIYTFYRLLIPLIQELKSYNKILYLDNDTIVLKNLDSLFQIKQENIYTLFYNKHHGNIKCYIKRIVEPYKKLSKLLDNLFFTKTYDNAGVILFNNSILSKKVVEYINRLNSINDIYDKSIFVENDQTILNLCFKHDVYMNKNMLFNTNIFYSDISYIFHYFGINKQQLLKNISKYEQLKKYF